MKENINKPIEVKREKFSTKCEDFPVNLFELPFNDESFLTAAGWYTMNLYEDGILDADHRISDLLNVEVSCNGITKTVEVRFRIEFNIFGIREV